MHQSDYLITLDVQLANGYQVYSCLDNNNYSDDCSDRKKIRQNQQNDLDG